jgi:hypothetical protein
MCILKLSQKNLAFIIIAFCFFFLSEPLASIIAVCALGYFNPLSRLGEPRIESYAKIIDSKLGNFSGKSH